MFHHMTGAAGSAGRRHATLLSCWALCCIACVQALFDESCVLNSLHQITTCAEQYRGQADPTIPIRFLHVLHACSNPSQAILSVNVSVPETFMFRLADSSVQPLLASAMLGMNTTFEPLRSWLDADVAWDGMQASGGGQHDAWVLNPVSSGSLMEADALQDLSDTILSDTHMQWQDIHPFYRLNSANYGGKVVMLPMDGEMSIMYLRTDVLAAHNLGMPRTWDELLNLAAVVNGTDMNQDNVTDYAVCLPQCFADQLLLAIWASIMQTHGMAQGLHYDINTMQVMANTSGMAYALSLGQRLFAYVDRSGLQNATFNQPCLSYEPSFADGKCAVTFGTTLQFKKNSHDGSCYAPPFCTTTVPRYVRGRVTAAGLPGSTTVFNRQTGALEPCTKTTCPYATPITTSGNDTALVNLTPWAGFGGFAAAINKHTATLNAYYVWFFVSWFTYPSNSITYVLLADSEIGPYRLSHLDQTLMRQSYGMTWTDLQAGYEAGDASSWLAAVANALSHPNIAMDLRMPNSHDYRSIVSQAAFMVSLGNMPIAEVMQYIAAASRQLVPSSAAAFARFRQQYWVSLNYVDVTPAPPPPGSHPKVPGGGGGVGGTSLSAGALVGIVVGVVVGAALLLVAAVVLLRRNKSLWSVILPPKAGPSTTILITDIENSTVLWETCEAEVMDAALKLHHTVIRKALIQYGGYESATEGDSFIVAFHSAHTALHFSLAVQLQLLQAPWPSALDHMPPSCCVSVAAPPNSLRSTIGRAAGGSGGGSSTIRSRSRSLLLGGSGGGGNSGILRSSSGGLRTSRHSLMAYHAPDHTLSLRWRPPATADSPTASSDMHGSQQRSTVRDCLADQYPIAAAVSPAGVKAHGSGVLLYRGLRVRIGFHSGVAKETDINSNAASGRTTYSGEPLAAARGVANAAHGGQVMLDDDAICALADEPQGNMAGGAVQHLILYTGLHKVKDELAPSHLYMATPLSLQARVALFKPVRSLVQLAPGVLQAPLGMVAAAVVSFPGASSLLDWNHEEASRALDTFQACCAQSACDHGGFPTASNLGEMTCAFHTCCAAVEWALLVIEAMKKEPWSDEVLSHPLCEELCVDHGAEAPEAAPYASPENRIKQLFQKKSGRGGPSSSSAALSKKSPRHRSRHALPVKPSLLSLQQPSSSAASVSTLRQQSMSSLHVSSLLKQTSSCDQVKTSPPQSAILSSPRTISQLVKQPSSCEQVSIAPSPLQSSISGQISVLVPPDIVPSSDALLPEDSGASSPASNAAQEPQQQQQQTGKAAGGGGGGALGSVLFRGPRIRAGVAFGDVHVEVRGTDGTVRYCGKVITQAKSIAASARSSQVLCSYDVSQGVAEYEERSALSGPVAVLCDPCGSLAVSAPESMLYKCRLNPVAQDRSVRAMVASGKDGGGSHPLSLDLHTSTGGVSSFTSSHMSPLYSGGSEAQQHVVEASASSATALLSSSTAQLQLGLL